MIRMLCVDAELRSSLCTAFMLIAAPTPAADADARLDSVRKRTDPQVWNDSTVSSGTEHQVSLLVRTESLCYRGPFQLHLNHRTRDAITSLLASHMQHVTCSFYQNVIKICRVCSQKHVLLWRHTSQWPACSMMLPPAKCMHACSQLSRIKLDDR
jgi:hypothetical protein